MAHFTVNQAELEQALASDGPATVRDAITGVMVTVERSGPRARPTRGDFGRIGRRALAGGRASLDDASAGLASSLAAYAALDAESEWRRFDLDTQTLAAMTPNELAAYLVDLSPEVSAGLWQWLRLCNPGWEATALTPGSDAPSPAGQAALNRFTDELDDLYGSADVVFNRLFLGAFMRGGVMAELVLDQAGRAPIDLATPDPGSARWRKVTDPARGVVWQIGQQQSGRFVALDRPTVRYAPIDPLPGKPWGRAPLAPAFFTGLFLLGMLHDLRRVVAQQGYPRLDIAVNFEALASQAPEDAQPGSEKFAAWVSSVMDEINNVYSQLEPDDAYVHGDIISVNRPISAVATDLLGGIDALMAALERMASRGLKLMPLLLGINQSTTETNANRQWEIQAAAVKSLQHITETVLERLLTLSLEAQGIAAAVRFRFAELRAAEQLRDAQTERLRIINAREKYAAGWISQDEAALEITGHAADAMGPRSAELRPLTVVDSGGVLEPARELAASRNGAHG